MSILDSPCSKWRIEYTELLEKEKKADEYYETLDKKKKNEFVTEEEVLELEAEGEKWKSKYNAIKDRLQYLLNEIRWYTPDNILCGWPELIKEKQDLEKKKLEEAKKELEPESVQADLGYPV